MIKYQVAQILLSFLYMENTNEEFYQFLLLNLINFMIYIVSNIPYLSEGVY
jgi:hypothetical protein